MYTKSMMAKSRPVWRMYQFHCIPVRECDLDCSYLSDDSIVRIHLTNRRGNGIVILSETNPIARRSRQNKQKEDKRVVVVVAVVEKEK